MNKIRIAHFCAWRQWGLDCREPDWTPEPRGASAQTASLVSKLMQTQYARP